MEKELSRKGDLMQNLRCYLLVEGAIRRLNPMGGGGGCEFTWLVRKLFLSA